MIVQNISFRGVSNSSRIRKPKNNETINTASNKASRLKKTLIAFGAVAAAGITIGIIAYKRGAKSGVRELIKDVSAPLAGAGLGMAAHELSTKKINQSEEKETHDEPVIKISETAIEKETHDEPIIEVFETKEEVPSQELAKEKTLQEIMPEISPEQTSDAEFENLLKMIKQSCGELTQEISDEPDAAEFIDYDVNINPEAAEYERLADDLIRIFSKEKTDSDYHNKILKEYDARIGNATAKYNQRVKDQLKLSDRMKMIAHRNDISASTLVVSTIRRMQLSSLSNKKMNALDNKTLYCLLFEPRGTVRLQNMQYLKTIPVTQLIRIQESEEGRTRLFQLLEYDIKGYAFDCITSFLEDI